jgi:translation initiation factor IF-2
MRVHEFAKRIGQPSREVIKALKVGKFDVKNHMSVLPAGAIEFLQNSFLKKTAPVQEKSAQQDEKLKNNEKNNIQVNDRKAAMQKASPYSQSAAKEAAIPTPNPVLDAPFVVEAMMVSDFAKRAKLPVIDVITTLLKAGQACAKNYILSEEMVAILCRNYEFEMAATQSQASTDAVLEKSNKGESRLPVVVVMGHVDHGKTTLLDYIRKTRVVSREKGGITQHLGAYEVELENNKNLVFLDTPGHEAFSKMRRRGASVADVAILVVAGDDGVMPQTVESIKAIKSLELPLVVAVTKMDKVDESRIDIIMRQLSQYDLLSEAWGGDVMCLPISAKDGTGIAKLLEMVALQAEMLELKTSFDGLARGYVLESKMQKGRGAVATVICQQGTLKVGDYFNVKNVCGRVVSLVNSAGKNVKEVSPSVPILVAGFQDQPSVGEIFQVIPEVDYRKIRSDAGQKSSSLFAGHLAASDDKQKFNIILKADTHSSLEAIMDAIKKFSKKEVKRIVFLRAGVGNISEGDVLLAETTGAKIFGFNVKPEHNATVYARRSQISTFSYDIIYKLLDDLEKMAARVKEIKIELKKSGDATVLKVFNIKKFGVIAGCIVNDGVFSEKGIVAVIRGKEEIARGKIKSLQRAKKTVKEVHSGFECGFIVEGFEGWEEGDRAECYLETSITS